jgi:hypothetical protein
MHYETIQILKEINKKDVWDIAGIIIPTILGICNLVLIYFTVKYTKDAHKTSETALKNSSMPILIVDEVYFRTSQNQIDQISLTVIFRNIGFEYFNFRKININKSIYTINTYSRNYSYVEISKINTDNFFYKENQENQIYIQYTDLYNREIKSLFKFYGNFIPKKEGTNRTEGPLKIENTFIEYD